MRKIALVLGYGVAHNMYERKQVTYLSFVLHYLRIGKHVFNKTDATVYFGGGFTSTQNCSEAGSMLFWFSQQELQKQIEFEMVTGGITAREILVEFRNRVGDVAVTIFCEQSRRRQINFLAQRLFSAYEVVGVPFDAAALSRWQRFIRLVGYLPLEILTWYVPFLWKIRYRVRQHRLAHIRRNRLPG